MYIPLSEKIRYQACTLQKDAGLREILKSVKDVIDDAMQSSEERVRVEEYLKKNPAAQRALEQMADLIPTPRP